MKLGVAVLDAGFGGLELSTMLSEALGERFDLTVIDKNNSFIFGYSKLDVMFGRSTLDVVRLAYRKIVKPGLFYDAEREMRYARRLSHSGSFQLDGLDAKLLEQAHALTEQDRHEVDVDFVQ